MCVCEKTYICQIYCTCLASQVPNFLKVIQLSIHYILDLKLINKSL